MDILKDNIGIIGVFFVVIIGVGIFFLIKPAKTVEAQKNKMIGEKKFRKKDAGMEFARIFCIKGTKK